MTTKLKIAFDPLNNWDLELFRDVMKSLSLQIDKYELYIVTSSEDTTKMIDIATILNIPTIHVYDDLESISDITDQLSTSRIDIYLTGFMDVNTATGASTLTIPVLVNPQLQDMYQMNPKWFDQLQFWIKRLTMNNEQESC